MGRDCYVTTVGHYDRNSSRAMTDLHARTEVLTCKDRQREWFRIHQKLFGVILEESGAGHYEIRNRTVIAERRSERDRSKTANPGSGTEIAFVLGLRGNQMVP